MPVAFFTRTQTGALVSRLNNDVIGAQQAFTSTLSGVVSQHRHARAGHDRDARPVVADHGRSRCSCSRCSCWPAKYVGRQIQGLTRQAMQVNAEMSTMMTERFNVSGALLVKLFGRPDEEDASFADKAGRVRDIGVKIAM